jgi:hypothetical protein
VRPKGTHVTIDLSGARDGPEGLARAMAALQRPPPDSALRIVAQGDRTVDGMAAEGGRIRLPGPRLVPRP